MLVRTHGRMDDLHRNRLRGEVSPIEPGLYASRAWTPPSKPAAPHADFSPMYSGNPETTRDTRSWTRAALGISQYVAPHFRYVHNYATTQLHSCRPRAIQATSDAYTANR
jgi:hypothetical protein